MASVGKVLVRIMCGAIQRDGKQCREELAYLQAAPDGGYVISLATMLAKKPGHLSSIGLPVGALPGQRYATLTGLVPVTFYCPIHGVPGVDTPPYGSGQRRWPLDALAAHLGSTGGSRRPFWFADTRFTSSE